MFEHTPGAKVFTDAGIPASAAQREERALLPQRE